MPLVKQVFAVEQPDAGFYLWLPTPIDDQTYCKRLYSEAGVKSLPGSYLTRLSQGIDPGANHIRLALVAPLQQCIEGIERLVEFQCRIRSDG